MERATYLYSHCFPSSCTKHSSIINRALTRWRLFHYLLMAITDKYNNCKLRTWIGLLYVSDGLVIGLIYKAGQGHLLANLMSGCSWIRGLPYRKSRSWWYPLFRVVHLIATQMLDPHERVWFQLQVTGIIEAADSTDYLPSCACPFLSGFRSCCIFSQII